jgi:hypothetical protein
MILATTVLLLRVIHLWCPVGYFCDVTFPRGTTIQPQGVIGQRAGWVMYASADQPPHLFAMPTRADVAPAAVTVVLSSQTYHLLLLPGGRTYAYQLVEPTPPPLPPLPPPPTPAPTPAPTFNGCYEVTPRSNVLAAGTDGNGTNILLDRGALPLPVLFPHSGPPQILQYTVFPQHDGTTVLHVVGLHALLWLRYPDGEIVRLHWLGERCHA